MSKSPITAESRAVATKTTLVDSQSSRGDDQETWLISLLTSLTKVTALRITPPPLRVQERQELNLQSRFWRPVVYR